MIWCNPLVMIFVTLSSLAAPMCLDAEMEQARQYLSAVVLKLCVATPRASFQFSKGVAG